MDKYHETTIGEAIETFSETEKNTMYYIIGSILQGEVKTYDDYEKLLSKMSKPNDCIVNALVLAAVSAVEWKARYEAERKMRMELQIKVQNLNAELLAEKGIFLG